MPDVNEIMPDVSWYMKVVHTSDRLVVTSFDTYGSSNASRSLDFANSIQQSHCFSISGTFVALRIITFSHLICKKNSNYFKQLKPVLLQYFHYIIRSWSQQIKVENFSQFLLNVKVNFWWMTYKETIFVNELLNTYQGHRQFVMMP